MTSMHCGSGDDTGVCCANVVLALRAAITGAPPTDTEVAPTLPKPAWLLPWRKNPAVKGAIAFGAAVALLAIFSVLPAGVFFGGAALLALLWWLLNREVP